MNLKKKILKSLSLMALTLGIGLFSSNCFAANEWFTGVTVTRVMSGEASLQIWGDKGCSFQASYASQTATSANSTNSAYLGRLMSLALSAQVAGKTISFLTDCTAGTIIQMCINNSILKPHTC